MKIDDLEKLYATMLQESIFSGNLDDDKDDKEDKDEGEDTEDTEDTDDEDSSDDSNDDDSDDDASDNDSSDNSDDDDEDEEEDSEDDEEDSGDSGVQSKIKTLQKQYNDILVDAFTKYAPECIECALEESEVAFGENVEGILQTALDSLRSKILADFGMEMAGEGGEGEEVCPMAMADEGPGGPIKSIKVVAPSGMISDQ